MSSLAIPAAPPPAAASTGNGAAPAAGDGHFGDTLRQTQSSPETPADGHPADDKAKPGKHAKPAPDPTDKSEHTQPDPRAKTDANAQPGLAPMLPAVPLAPAPVRQASAAEGKSLPAATAKIPAALLATAAGDARATATVPATTSATATTAPIAVHTAGPGQAKPTPVGTQPAESVATTSSADTEAGTTAWMSMQDSDAPVGADAGKNSAPLRPGLQDFSASLTQLINVQPAPATSPAPPPIQLALQATPGQPQFTPEIAQQVSWLVGQGVQKAEIQLNPGKLGPIHVEIATHHDRVDVTFAVQHPQTVNALQQTLPQLHDMLAQQGLNLGQASVGQQPAGQQHAPFAQHPGSGRGGSRHRGNAKADPPPTWRTLRIATPGRVDDFA